MCFVPLRSTSAHAIVTLNSVYTISFILPQKGKNAIQSSKNTLGNGKLVLRKGKMLCKVANLVFRRAKML